MILPVSRETQTWFVIGHVLRLERHYPLHQVKLVVKKCNARERAGQLRMWHMHGVSSEPKINTKFKSIDRNNQRIRKKWIKIALPFENLSNPMDLTSWIINSKLNHLCVKESQCEKSQCEREIPQCEILGVCKSKCENSHLKVKQNLSVNA